MLPSEQGAPSQLIGPATSAKWRIDARRGERFPGGGAPVSVWSEPTARVGESEKFGQQSLEFVG